MLCCVVFQFKPGRYRPPRALPVMMAEYGCARRPYHSTACEVNEIARRGLFLSEHVASFGPTCPDSTYVMCMFLCMCVCRKSQGEALRARFFFFLHRPPRPGRLMMMSLLRCEPKKGRIHNDEDTLMHSASLSSSWWCPLCFVRSAGMMSGRQDARWLIETEPGILCETYVSVTSAMLFSLHMTSGGAG